MVFRRPNEQKITLYLQQDFALHTTSDFTEKGFVLSPFSPGEKVYIPADSHHSFPIKGRTSRDDALAVLPESPAQKQLFLQQVAHAKIAIEGGDFEKVVLSRPLYIESKKSALAVFQELIELYPNAFVYCWHHPKIGLWLGATPERFVALDKGELKTMALAGTLPYMSKFPEWTTKELHEQALVTKSIKEDLAKAFPGSALQVGEVENLRAGGVYHLRTQILLQSPAIDLNKVVNALHPTPAVGGLPKSAAVQFIKETEGYDREFYTGFLGPFSGTEKADFFVNLRCAKQTEKGYTVYVGAGITADSDPEKEYAETQRKAQTLGKSLLF